MISLNLFNQSFNHEVSELIRAFFPEINIVDEKGYYKLISEKDRVGIRTSLYKSEELMETIVEEGVEAYTRRELKDLVKRHVYLLLNTYSERSLPWGILTGIRPTKLVHELMDKSMGEKEIKNILGQRYFISDNRINLLLDIVKEERMYIYPLDRDRYSIYISIPFCPSKCLYCSFPSYKKQKYEKYFDQYIDTLLLELREVVRHLDKKKIYTLYIGGGTPTSLSHTHMKKLLKGLDELWDLSKVKEVTIEAGRPDTLSHEIFTLFSDYNVDRISINPQTMSDKTLRLIGREHTSEDIVKMYKKAKFMDKFIINMDLIVGLPGEDRKDIIRTMEIIRKLDPDNLTVHTLSIKRGSKFSNSLGKYKVMDSDYIDSMLDITRLEAKSMGLRPYYLYRQKQSVGNFENIGYAKPEKSCIYNMFMMEERETILGFGVGATSKIFDLENMSIKRLANFKSLDHYFNRIDEEISKKLVSLDKIHKS